MKGWDLSVRVRGNNPNHHLFNNHGTWWCHFWAVADGVRQQRFRVNLKTSSRTKARSQRNRILQSDWKQIISQGWKTVTLNKLLIYR